MKEKIFKFITKLKILKDRSVGFISIFNMLMIVALYLKDYRNFTFLGLNGVVILIIGVIGIIVLTLFDYIYILPREQEFYFQNNPEFQRKMRERNNDKKK